MTLFDELYRSATQAAPSDGSLATWQRQADARFPSVVSQSPLRLWSPGDPVSVVENRLLIGAATWSAHDMKLLDTLSGVLQSQNPALIVEVFNVADCSSQEAFDRYVPGVRPVFQTPVVGLWSDGQL